MSAQTALRKLWEMPEAKAAKIIQPSRLTVSFTNKKIADHTEPVVVIRKAKHKRLIARIARKMWHHEAERREGRYTVECVLDCLGVIEKRKAGK